MAHTQLTLNEHLDITQISKIYEKLKQSLSKSKDIVLVCSKVERTDTAGLQLLVALKKELKSTGGSLTFKSVPESLMKSAKVAGISKFLEIGNS